MDVLQAINLLGYTQAWIDCGVITEEFVVDQAKLLSEAEDKNTEHYRWGAFKSFIERKEFISDQELLQLLSLEDKGHDECDLSINRAIEIIISGLLSDEQLNSISNHPILEEKSVSKRYIRERICREIESRGLVEEVFESVVLSEDNAVHEYALSSSTISKSQVEWFSNNSSRKIKNIAGQLLRSRRFSGEDT